MASTQVAVSGGRDLVEVGYLMEETGFNARLGFGAHRDADAAGRSITFKNGSLRGDHNEQFHTVLLAMVFAS